MEQFLYEIPAIHSWEACRPALCPQGGLGAGAGTPAAAELSRPCEARAHEQDGRAMPGLALLPFSSACSPV